MKKRISLLLGLAFSLFFLWLGFRGLELGELWEELSNINLLYPLLAVPVFFLAIYVLTWRWYYLLRNVQDVRPNRLYPVVLIGYMANNLLPLRLGEVMRAYVLKRRDEAAIPPTLATILVERVFDGLVMLTFIFTALLFVDFEEETLRTIITVTTPLFFGAMGIFFWLASSPQVARRIYTWALNTFVPERLRAPILDIIEDLMRGFEALRSARALLLVIFFSFLSWTIEASTYWIVMQAFDFEVTFTVLLLVIGFGNLVTILPSTAGYIGTFHGVAILTLTAFGVGQAAAGSYAVVMHATLWGPITLVGFIFLLRLGFKWSDFDRAQEVVEEAEEQTHQQINRESEVVV